MWSLVIVGAFILVFTVNLVDFSVEEYFFLNNNWVKKNNKY